MEGLARPAPRFTLRSRSHVDGVAREDVWIDSSDTRPISATILGTVGSRHEAVGLLMLHWGFGDRLSLLGEGLEYAKAGAIVLLVDAPEMGDRGRGLPRLDVASIATDYLRRAIADLRTAVDFLVVLGVSEKRVGYVGHSLGASLGAVLVGIDSRIAAGVLLAGTGDLSRGVWSIAPSREYQEAMQPLDAVHAIGRARTELLLQFGNRDEFIDRATAERLIAAAPRADVRWYDADHRLNRTALLDRIVWLCHRLGLSPPQVDAVGRLQLPIRDRLRYAVIGPIYGIAKRRLERRTRV